MIPFHLSSLGPHLVQSCKLNDATVSVSSYVQGLEGLDSFWSSTCLLFLHLFFFSFHRSPWTLRKRPYRDIHFSSWCSKFSHCLTLAGLWVFGFFPISQRRNLLQRWLSMTLILVKQNAIIYRYNLILHCYKPLPVFNFPVGTGLYITKYLASETAIRMGHIPWSGSNLK